MNCWYGSWPAEKNTAATYPGLSRKGRGYFYGKEAICMEPKTIIGIALVLFIVAGLAFLHFRKKK